MTAEFSIGRLAKAAGTSVQTIRHYERIGLMPAAPRSDGNQRLYDQGAQRRLIFIRHARELGFSLEAIRELLDLSDRPEQSCASVDAIARRNLEAVEQRILRLSALRQELARMVDQCRGGRVADCRVIEILSDHALCLVHDHTPTPDHAEPPRQV